MGRKKLNMEEKTRALTLLEQGMPGKRVAEELSVSRKSIYRLKMEAAKPLIYYGRLLFRETSQILAYKA